MSDAAAKHFSKQDTRDALSGATAGVALTPEQTLKMGAIQKAVTALEDGEVPFMLYASPDDVSAEMRFIHGHKLTYGKGDLASVAADVGTCRSKLLAVILKQLSVGLSGGIVLHDKDGSPVCVFEEGRMNHVREDRSKRRHDEGDSTPAAPAPGPVTLT